MENFSTVKEEQADEHNNNINDQENCTTNPKRRKTPRRAATLNQQQSQQADINEDDANDDPTLTPNKSGEPILVKLSDPDVLDCSICSNPLTIPVFQCVNGHIACSPCCNNIRNKCPSCSRKIGKNRCRAIEKVIESVQVSCCYQSYGCEEIINYCKLREHENNCAYVPCPCPFLDCLFLDIPTKLSSHVGEKHADLVVHFGYDSVFSVTARKNQNSLVLLKEEKNGTLFILSHGNTLVIKCIDSSLAHGKFAYDLVLKNGSSSLKFQSFTHCTTERYNDRLSEDYVLIPGYFYTIGGLLELEICIRSKDATTSS